MKSKLTRSLAALVVVVLAVLAASAQTRDSAVLKGRVLDARGAAVAGAHIKLNNSAVGDQRTAQTDENGVFAFFALRLTGTYGLSIEKQGFARFAKDGIQLVAGSTASLDCILQVAGENTTLVVYGTAAGVQADSDRLQTRLELDTIDELPVAGRRISTLPLINSAVRPARGTGDVYLGNTLFAVDAGGRRQTTFSVDNGTADDSWGRQTFFTNIPFSAVQEFSVLTNASSAEYGRTTGGAVNVVTKSGTGAFHGDLLGLWRPSSIEANPPAAQKRAAETLRQGSGSLSGPIVRDRTYFMLSGEYSAQQRDSYIQSVLGPGVYTGEYREALGLARLDHQLSPNHHLALRLNFDRFHDTNPSDTVGANNLPSTARVYRRRAYDVQLSETAIVSPTLMNEARAQFQLGSPMGQFTPVTPTPQFSYPGIATWGESRSNNILNHQYQFADTVSLVRHRHTLKFGTDVIYSSNGGYGQEFGSGFMLGQFTVKPNITRTPDQLTIADISAYSQTLGNYNYNIRETIFAAFAQDDVAVSNSLTVNLGLRYELQSFTDATKNFAPRLGFAWKLPGTQATVVRGGYNVFYSELRANLAANWTTTGPEGIFSYTAGPGQIGFPSSLAPLSTLPIGANVPARDIWVRPGSQAYIGQFLDVSKLRWFPDSLLNPYTQQWTLGVERELAKNWVLSVDYVGQHTIRIDRPVDLNAPDSFLRTAPGQVRTKTAADATRPILPVAGGYRRVLTSANLGAAYYDGLQVNLRKRLSHNLFLLASYTWSHTLGTVEADASSQDPNDSNFLGRQELASSVLDQRHRFVLTGWYQLPWHLNVGTSTTLASGRPYNVTTGVDNNGDNSNSDRPVINGFVVPRNYGQGTPTYDVATFVEKQMRVTERLTINLRGEALNLLNHDNVVVRQGVYGNAATPASNFGTPLAGINNVDPGRSFQFQLGLRF